MRQYKAWPPAATERFIALPDSHHVGEGNWWGLWDKLTRSWIHLPNYPRWAMEKYAAFLNSPEGWAEYVEYLASPEGQAREAVRHPEVTV